MERDKSRHRRVVAIALGLAAIVGLGACGSSSSSSSSATTTSSSATTTATAASSGSAATGSTVDLWTAAPIGAANASAPQASAGVKAAFRYLNSHGGLGPMHQKVVVKVCNTNLTPNGEIQCGQQAASDPKAVAMVAPIIVIATQPFTGELQKAGLPVVNPAASAQPVIQGAINFPLGAEYLDAAGCAVMVPRALHATRVGFATTALPGSIAITNLGVAAAKKAGSTVVGNVQFPITATDVTPFVSQLAQKNPQVVVLEASPQLVGGWLAAAARLGKSVPICVGDRLIPNPVLLGLGPAAKDFYVAASYPDPAWSGYPLLVPFREQAAAEVAAGDSAASLAATNNTEDVLVGWLAAQALIQATANVNGALTRANVLDALNHAKVTFGTGKPVLPAIDFAKPNPNPQYPRLFNTEMFLKTWDISKKQFVAVPGVQPVNDQIVP